MEFYSLPAIGIFVLLYLVYYIRPFARIRIQNILLLIASYSCYALLSWKFLLLVIGISLISFFAGKSIADSSTNSGKKTILVIITVILLAILGFFRYYNFFIPDLDRGLNLIGIDLPGVLLKIVVPLGISVYTLQVLSYTFEIYRNKIEPVKDITAFFAYVSFFPQMFAGPVERATTLLPQFLQERQYSIHDVRSGLKRILWGLFKKLVIANNLAVYANEVFSNYTDYTGFTVFAGLVSFALQFYADISGLSDIAVGSARLFGFKLYTNFKFPYFSVSLNDFWSRWNISLMDWIKEYIYYPLGGKEGRFWVVFRNLFILFLIVGLWHGGNASYILFGLINAIIILPSTLKNADATPYAGKKYTETLKSIFGFLITGLFIIVGLTFFRADSGSDAIHILKNLFTNTFTISINELRSLGNGLSSTIANIIILFLYIILEWFQRNREYAFDFEHSKAFINKQKFIYLTIFLLLLFFFQGNPEYVYLRF